MSRIYVATDGPSDWRARLASPERHWKRGRSALELAVSWEKASQSPSGMPHEVVKLLSTVPELAGSRLLLGVVEHKVPLPGGSTPSQNDLWALLSSPAGQLVSMTVEGKAGERFDRTVKEWLEDAKPTSGKPARLEELTRVLGLATSVPTSIRYQLLHRSASALLEAKRCHASSALMLVQSFADDTQSETDFRAFAALFGIAVGRGECRPAGSIDGVTFYVGWVSSTPATDREVAESLAEAV